MAESITKEKVSGKSRQDLPEENDQAYVPGGDETAELLDQTDDEAKATTSTTASYQQMCSWSTTGSSFPLVVMDSWLNVSH